MPYIHKVLRNKIDKLINISEDISDFTEGELNYCITKICLMYINNFGLSYKTINSVIGILECIKLELYRRVAIPYEDIKIEQNGDVYIKGEENG